MDEFDLKSLKEIYNPPVEGVEGEEIFPQCQASIELNPLEKAVNLHLSSTPKKVPINIFDYLARATKSIYEKLPSINKIEYHIQDCFPFREIILFYHQMQESRNK